MIDKNTQQIGSFVISKKVMKTFKKYCFYDKVSMSEVIKRLVMFYTSGEFRDIFDEEKYRNLCDFYNIPYKEDYKYGKLSIHNV